MELVIPNTNPDRPLVTLFGRLNDGGFAGQVMEETSVPYSLYWEDSIEQVMVYLHPTDEQLLQMLDALNEGRLDFDHLQDYGASTGGISVIQISDEPAGKHRVRSPDDDVSSRSPHRP